MIEIAYYNYHVYSIVLVNLAYVTVWHFSTTNNLPQMFTRLKFCFSWMESEAYLTVKNHLLDLIFSYFTSMYSSRSLRDCS